MQERHTDRERYFKELAQTSKEFYIDYLQNFKSVGAGTRVLEIGCGEGGNLLPLAEAGCSVTGIDLATNKIEHAKEYFGKRNMPGEFISGNFLNMPPREDRFEYPLSDTFRRRNTAYRLMGTATQTLFTGMQESSLHHATHKWQIEQLSC